MIAKDKFSLLILADSDMIWNFSVPTVKLFPTTGLGDFKFLVVKIYRHLRSPPSYKNSASEKEGALNVTSASLEKP